MNTRTLMMRLSQTILEKSSCGTWKIGIPIRFVSDGVFGIYLILPELGDDLYRMP
jgi:hypothetical protein